MVDFQLFSKAELRESERALDNLVEMAQKNSSVLSSMRDAIDENEGLLQEMEEQKAEVERMLAENAREREYLQTARLELHADKIRYDGLMKKAEERLDLLERKPIILLEEVMLALECDETPEQIAKRFKDTHELFTGQWA
ncbi:MAG: hypothetical protein RR740_00395 [Pseudomonas sp.]